MSEIVAERVRRAREHRGWSQKELAKRATIHHVVLNRLEKGHKAGVQAETIRRLAEALRVSSDYLLGLKAEMDPMMVPTAVAQALRAELRRQYAWQSQ